MSNADNLNCTAGKKVATKYEQEKAELAEERDCPIWHRRRGCKENKEGPATSNMHIIHSAKSKRAERETQGSIPKIETNRVKDTCVGVKECTLQRYSTKLRVCVCRLGIDRGYSGTNNECGRGVRIQKHSTLDGCGDSNVVMWDLGRVGE